ncbi:hypothetical protein NAD41_000883 [Salmonella enterica]|nr:hypothetical protein [Salmonella enterica]EKK6596267.1 hypothetical protein [Salmonella enterica]
MAILVESGRAAVATAIVGQPLHLAWGSGDVVWDSSTLPPAPSTGATTLVAEVGRRVVTQTQYCTPKTGGEIIVSQGQFTATPNNAPSKYLYLRFAYDFMDAANVDIRELGVFVGGTMNGAGTNGYWDTSRTPPTNPGQLLVLENIQKLHRSQQVKQQFEFVIQF